MSEQERQDAIFEGVPSTVALDASVPESKPECVDAVFQGVPSEAEAE